MIFFFICLSLWVKKRNRSHWPERIWVWGFAARSAEALGVSSTGCGPARGCGRGSCWTAPPRAVRSSLIPTRHSEPGVGAAKVWRDKWQVSVPVGMHGGLVPEGKEGRQSTQLSSYCRPFPAALHFALKGKKLHGLPTQPGTCWKFSKYFYTSVGKEGSLVVSQK